jgi:Family of unknown function (DUF6494)
VRFAFHSNCAVLRWIAFLLFQIAVEGAAADRTHIWRTPMNEERFNISLRKFLKQVGVTSQREIERIVREKSLGGTGKLKVRMVLTADGTDLNHVIEEEIDLG